MSAYAKQQPVRGCYVGEGVPRTSTQSFPHYDATSDDDNYQPGLSALPRVGVHEPYSGGTERLSRRDWYEARQACTCSPAQADRVWHSKTAHHGLGACQAISPGMLGANVRLPGRW